MLEIAVCSLAVLIDYPKNLLNADILGHGNLNLVSEKSGKSQGILLSIICGNPEWFIYNFGLMGPGTHCFPYQWVQLQTYESRTLLFMTIPLHPGTSLRDCQGVQMKKWRKNNRI